jgi:hypothetical protein
VVYFLPTRGCGCIGRPAFPTPFSGRIEHAQLGRFRAAGSYFAVIASEAIQLCRDVREKLDLAGCEPKSAPREQFADIIKSDVALWARVVKDAGITAD